MFSIYFGLGIEHIADIRAYDHILFLLAMSAVYQLIDWKKVLVLVTAFTIGHSVTLALATFKVISISTPLVEFLIPLTVSITAVANFFYKDNEFLKSLHLFKYISALFFGLIHGLGFSNFLSAMLGSEESLTVPLFAFNVGLEIGQILIMLAILSITSAFVALRTAKRDLVLVISGAALGVSAVMMVERAADLF